MRKIIIGDIHGCDRELRALLEKVRPGEEDRLILLGDLFDRGPDSWEVFQTVRGLAEQFGERFTLLRGNHEDYLLQEKMSWLQQRVWKRVGKGSTESSFAFHGERMEDAAPWLREHCRLFYRDEEIQCVHAGLMVTPIEVNDTNTLVHDHGITLRNIYRERLTVVGHIALKAPVYFAGDKETTLELPYGEWQTLPDRGVICIDTGCGKGGFLTAMILEDGRYSLVSQGVSSRDSQ